MFVAALGCNLAWGLVDAVMYLVRTITDRGRSLTLIRSVRVPPDAAAGRRLIEEIAVARRGGSRLDGGDRGDARAHRRAAVGAGAADAAARRLARRRSRSS